MYATATWIPFTIPQLWLTQLTIELYCMFLPVTLPCRTTWQIANSPFSCILLQINVCNPWFMGLAYVIAWVLPIIMMLVVVLSTQRISESMPSVCKRNHYGYVSKLFWLDFKAFLPMPCDLSWLCSVVRTVAVIQLKLHLLDSHLCSRSVHICMWKPPGFSQWTVCDL